MFFFSKMRLVHKSQNLHCRLYAALHLIYILRSCALHKGEALLTEASGRFATNDEVRADSRSRNYSAPTLSTCKI